MSTITFATLNPTLTAGGWTECAKHPRISETDPRWALEAAAMKGHVYCMHRAIVNGAIPNELTAATAAEHDSLECLEYLHENGYPWDDLTLKGAVRGESQECLSYAIENGCPFPEDNNLSTWARVDHRSSESIRMLVRVVGITSVWLGAADWERLCPRLRAVYGDEAPKVAYMLYTKSCRRDKSYMLEQMATTGLCDMESNEWRKMLFDRDDLEGAVREVVEAKKAQIEETKRVAMEVLPVCPDVIKHVLFGYF